MNKCINYDKCPSYSGWCNNKQPNGECVEFLLSAYENLCEVNTKLEKYNSELCIEMVVLLNELSLVKKENETIEELTEQLRIKNKYAILANLANKIKEKTNDIN